MPSISSLLAKFTTPGERGKIMGCGSLFMSAADIIGPIIFGWLYRQDVNLVWYAGGSALFLGWMLLRTVDAVLEKKRRARKVVDNKSPGKLPTDEEDLLMKNGTHSSDVDCLDIPRTSSLFCNMRDEDEFLAQSQNSDLV
jgi:MFS family permease